MELYLHSPYVFMPLLYTFNYSYNDNQPSGVISRVKPLDIVYVKYTSGNVHCDAMDEAKSQTFREAIIFLSITIS